MRRTAFFVLAALAALLIASPAHAVVIGPGGGSSTLDTLSSLSGLTLVTSTTGSLDNKPGGTIDATYTEWVYKTGSGTLDFFYQVHNLTGSDSLTEIGVSSFTYNTTDVGIYTGSGLGVSGGVAPNAGPGGDVVDRTTSGSAIDFQFTGPAPATPVNPGSYSAILYVATNAIATISGRITVQDDTSSYTGSLGPATPEPSSMVLIGLGAMGFAGYGLRRRKARTA